MRPGRFCKPVAVRWRRRWRRMPSGDAIEVDREAVVAWSDIPFPFRTASQTTMRSFTAIQYREQVAIRSVISPLEKEERIMPLLVLWVVPAVIVIGGASYWLLHLH